jgi:hypothetical protein
MRRVVFGFVASLVLSLASVGLVSAAPSSAANCIADSATSVAPGTLGPALSELARTPPGGLGWFVGGNGEGSAPTDCG